MQLTEHIKNNRTDIVLLVLLSVIMFLAKYPTPWIPIHGELFIALTHLPAKFSEILLSIFKKWPPPDGFVYRPIQIYIFPYIYFKLFQFNNHLWLAANLFISSLPILLVYILAKLLQYNRTCAFLTALFYYSYYSSSFTLIEIAQYDPECIYMVFYLLSLICFIYSLDKNKNTYAPLVFFIMGLMSKEVVGLLPFVVFLYLLLYRIDNIKKSFESIRRILKTSPFSAKSYFCLFKDRGSLLHRLGPYFIIWIAYLSGRIFYPWIAKGTLGDANKSTSLVLSPSVIINNIASLSSYITEYYFLQKPDGISFLPFILMGILFIFSTAIFVQQALLGNKRMLFGFGFFLLNVSIFIFMNAEIAAHHPLLCYAGIALIFGESARIAFEQIDTLFSSAKTPSKQFGSTAVTILLTLYMAFYAIYCANTNIEAFVNASKTGISKFYLSLYDTLPKPKDRKSNTVFYIKNSEGIFNRGGDYFWMTIKPAYYGKDNIKVYHESRLDYARYDLASYSDIDWNFIVIKYLENDTVVDITSPETIEEIRKYTRKGADKFVPPTNPSFAEWNMDNDANNILSDGGRKYDATAMNTLVVEGHSGKARYLNGKDSYIQTTIDLHDWKGLTISFWVKPEAKEFESLSILLDNGHTAKTDCAIQTADTHGEKWVWHCNGTDLFFDLPLNKWSHVAFSVDGEKGTMRLYVNGVKSGEIIGHEGFKFGSAPLIVGKLASANDRFFKGSIDELIIWDKIYDDLKP